MKVVCVVLILNCSFAFVVSYTKIFKYDTDISNSDNWVETKGKKECEGLIFPEILRQQWYLDKIEVNKLVLPTEGLFIFARNGQLIFEANSGIETNCVQIKSDELHYWEDPQSWKTKELLVNLAVPHKERVPCQYDDVVLPKGPQNFYVFSEKSTVKINRLLYQDTTYQDAVNLQLENNDGDSKIIITDKNSKCMDPSGCVCGNANLDVCSFITESTTADCINPIFPYGFCYEICGASLLLQIKNGFSLKDVQQKLTQYQSNTYASKIQVNDTQEAVQVIFTERNFTGGSLEEATDFYDLVKSGIFLGVEDVQLFASRALDTGGLHFWYIFIGTFLGVITFFSVIFSLQVPHVSRVIRNARLNARPLSTYMFARYDGSEERGCIIESQSLAASVLTLNVVSLDNPTYSANVQPTNETENILKKSSSDNDTENTDTTE